MRFPDVFDIVFERAPGGHAFRVSSRSGIFQSPAEQRRRFPEAILTDPALAVPFIIPAMQILRGFTEPRPAQFAMVVRAFRTWEWAKRQHLMMQVCLPLIFRKIPIFAHMSFSLSSVSTQSETAVCIHGSFRRIECYFFNRRRSFSSGWSGSACSCRKCSPMVTVPNRKIRSRLPSLVNGKSGSGESSFLSCQILLSCNSS